MKLEEADMLMDEEKCPRCDDDLFVNNHDSPERTVECISCDWVFREGE